MRGLSLRATGRSVAVTWHLVPGFWLLNAIKRDRAISTGWLERCRSFTSGLST